MNTSKAGDEAYRETAARLQELARDDIPTTMRALAEENIAHTREIMSAPRTPSKPYSTVGSGRSAQLVRAPWH